MISYITFYESTDSLIRREAPRSMTVLRFATIPLLAATLLLTPPGTADAHPHAWIDMTVEVVFDQGKVGALRETWLFDDYYTAYATEDMDEDGDGKPDDHRLRALLEENMRNLAEYNYFTQVTSGGKNLAFGKVAEMSSRMNGTRLEMTFLLPLAAPLDVRERPMVYGIYDPTYYIEILHAEKPDAIRLTAAPAGCTTKLEEPHPTIEAAALAASIDSLHRTDNTLGALFAQRVTVRCP
jgi:ABC-type uncharacterized transport system substrate-binding protein